MLSIGVRTEDGSAVGETTLPTVWVEKRETKDYVIECLRKDLAWGRSESRFTVKEKEVVRLVVTEGFDGGRFMRVWKEAVFE